MLRAVIGRAAVSLIMLFVITVALFVISRLHGNPLRSYDYISPKVYREESKAMGLDRPLWEQYLIFIRRAVKGDLGKSLRTEKPVREMVFQRVPSSLKLVAFSSVVGLLLAIPGVLLGWRAAVRRGRAMEAIYTVWAGLWQSVPLFWLGPVLILLFAAHFHWFPSPGKSGPISYLHYVLPGLTLGWWIGLGVMHLLHWAMLERRVQEVRAAQAWRKALSRGISSAAFYLPLFLLALILVETTFAWPGVGRLAYEAVMWRDFPIVQGVVLVGAVALIAVHFLLNVLHLWVNQER